MANICDNLITTVFGCFLACVSTAGFAAQTVVVQAPCPANPCLSFGPTGAIPAVRTITATAPFTGVAIATFHGAMNCKTMMKADSYASFETQILPSSVTTPDGTGSGGLQLLSTLSTAADHVVPASMAYNLASERTFGVTQGQQLNLAFRVGRTLMGQDTTCTIGKSAAFVVQFAR